MRVSRRPGLCLSLAAGSLRAAPPRAAHDRQALVWPVQAGDRPPNRLLGYARGPPSVAPDVVTEGSKRATDAKRVIQDFHGRVALPAIRMDGPQSTPLLGKLDDKTGAALRAVVQKSFPQLASTIDRLGGV